MEVVNVYVVGGDVNDCPCGRGPNAVDSGGAVCVLGHGHRTVTVIVVFFDLAL